MKRKILLLLFIPLVSFGQTYEYEVETTYDPLMNSSKSTVKRKDNNSPYGEKKYRPDIKPFVPDYNSFERAIKNRATEKLRTKTNAEAIDDLIKSQNNKYNSRNNAASLDHANLIRNYHKSLITTTLLPWNNANYKPIDNTPKIYSSDVFLIVKYPSFNGKTNSMGTQVYSASAYYSFNKQLKAFEIFNVYVEDEDYEYNDNIFKKNHPWEFENKMNKLKDVKLGLAHPCPSNDFFVNPMIINQTGKVTGGYQSLYIATDCISWRGQKKTNIQNIELYFIKDLEKFSKQ